jgi:hypothetical protein
MGLAGDLEHLTRVGKDLTGDKERNKLLGHLPEIYISTVKIILMATIGYYP